MKKISVITLFTLCFGIQNLWGSASTYKLSAGTKTIEFSISNAEWSDFCIDKKMGCARFKLIKENNKFEYGLVKVLSEKIDLKSFNEYCKNAFEESKNIDKNLSGYSEQIKQTLPTCSWSAGKDSTTIFWKSGLTIMLTYSDKTEKKIISVMIDKAKVYEKI